MSLPFEIFQYHKPSIPDDCRYNISPSRLALFYDESSRWYRETMLEYDPLFKGNTSSVLGTICHYCYNKTFYKEEIDKKYIESSLYQYYLWRKEQEYPEIDCGYILNTYPLIYNAVVQFFLAPKVLMTNKIVESEKQVVKQLDGNIYLAGTIDMLDGDSIIDFKHVSKKPGDKIPFAYKLQLLAYWVALGKPKEYDKIKIVYGIHPTKIFQARCSIIEEPITEKDEKFIDETLEMCIDTIHLVEKQPELAYLIFKDYSLKEQANVRYMERTSS